MNGKHADVQSTLRQLYLCRNNSTIKMVDEVPISVECAPTGYQMAGTQLLSGG